MMFSRKAIQALKYYVYGLKYPEGKKNYFYIGKGKGNRVFSHINQKVRRGIKDPKYDIIESLRTEGKTPKIDIIRHGLTEYEALLLESALIDVFGVDQITNKVRGVDSTKYGLMSPKVVEENYKGDVFESAAWKKDYEKEISNKLWNMTLDKLQDTTVIYRKGRRTGSSGVMRLTDREIGSDIKFVLSQAPGIFLYISNPDKKVSIDLMQKIMRQKNSIESELGFQLSWSPSNRRAQYISFHYKGDLTNNSKFSEKEWPRPLKSWGDTFNPTNLVPLHEDLEIMTKFFSEIAPRFEKVMRKYVLKIIK